MTETTKEKFAIFNPEGGLGKIIASTAIAKAINEKYPENQNLKITNIHDPYIHIYDDGNWKIKKKGKVIDDIIVDKFEMMDINIDSDDEELIEKKSKLETKIVNREKDKFIVNEVTETIINQSKKIFNE